MIYGKNRKIDHIKKLPLVNLIKKEIIKNFILPHKPAKTRDQFVGNLR